MSKSLYTKTDLKNLANLDHSIQRIKLKDPEIHDTLRTVGRTLRGLIDETYPRHPDILWESRLHLAGPAIEAETNSLPYYLHVRMPVDDSWSFNSIKLDKIITTVQNAATGATLILDLLVLQSQVSSTFKSLFQSGNPNKINIPIGIKTVSSVNFSINQLGNDNLIRLDVIQTDPNCAGIEIHLIGSYSTTEKV